MKSTSDTAAATPSVNEPVAHVRDAMELEILSTSYGGRSESGPDSRTSAPISAPITISDRPMLYRQSPTNAYDSASYGLPLASCIVRKSASICVGCHSLVSPL